MMYDVTVTFRVDGLAGRHRYSVEATSRVAASNDAFFRFEREAVEAGLAVDDCTCCLLSAVDGGDVESIDVEVAE